MLGIKSDKKPITGKYAKRLTEIISRGQVAADSKKKTIPSEVKRAPKLQEVVWE